MDKKEIDAAVKRTVKEYGGTLKALGVDAEAERIIRADERAKIRSWVKENNNEDFGVVGYEELLAFLDSLDSPSNNERKE